MKDIDPEVFTDLVITMSDFISDYFFKQSSCLIYHYASFDNALSITGNFKLTVGGSVLYHTRFDCLSDDYEGQDVEECYFGAINQYIASHTLQQNIVDLLYSIKPNDTYYYYLTEGPGIDHAYNAKGVAYICCFSLKGDSKYMWNSYLKGAKTGFALGYNVINLKSNSNDYFGNGYKHIIQKVLYKKEDKIRYIYNFLDNLLSRTQVEQHIRFYVSNFLNCNKYVFKRECYFNEQEVRSVIFYPLDKKCNLKTINDGKTIPFKFDFGTSIDEIVYYHRGSDERERFLLSQTHVVNSIKESEFSEE